MSPKRLQYYYNLILEEPADLQLIQSEEQHPYNQRQSYGGVVTWQNCT